MPERATEQAFLESESIPHNCGILGFYRRDGIHLNKFVQHLKLLYHRGQEGSGIATISENGRVSCYKSSSLFSENLSQNGFYETLSSQGNIIIAVGHNRYSTAGNLEATQPFVHPNLITAHNGNLTNARELLKNLHPNIYPEVVSDTDILHRFILLQEGHTLDDKIKNALPRIWGAYSLILAAPQEQVLYGIRDPWG